MKKIFILEGRNMHPEFNWVHEKAFENLIDAQKEVYWLEQGSMDEDTGEVSYYTIKQIELQ